MNKPVREGFQTEPAAETAQAPAPAVLLAETWPMIVKLKHGAIRDPSRPDDIRELQLRHPTGGDINYCGAPIRMDENGNFIIDDRHMHLMIARLAGILSPILDQIDARDWQTAAYKLFRFFLPGPAAWGAEE
jgi:hypothetical protein